VPSLANSNSVPAPEDEKLSQRGIDAEGRRIAGTDGAGGDNAGVMGWPKIEPVFAPLIVTGRPSPSVISLIKPGFGPDRFSIAT
jgi:hypothetical protein